MAENVISLVGELNLEDNFTPGLKKAKDEAKSFSDRVKDAGKSVSDFGGDLLRVSAPVSAMFGLAIHSSMRFDEAMTNTAAVMGLTREETEALGDQLLRIGADSQAGPQAIAEAYYDVAGGVSDASLHMDILNAAIATAEAGNADLAGTTKGLISVMNSYEFAATDASYASDVLTQTVGMGVGSMDELARAMPLAAGLANSLSIEFDDLGVMMAFLSTKGNTFAESATQISAMMTAMIKPNQQMTEALKDLGFTTGQAAIDALGLQGAYQALIDAGHGDEMAALTGSVEALRGVTSLASPAAQGLSDAMAQMGPFARDAYIETEGYNSSIRTYLGLEFGSRFSNEADILKKSGYLGFVQEFRVGLTGATDAAREIQLTSVSAQFKDMTTDMEAMGIRIGEAVTPALIEMWKQFQPIVAGVSDWIAQNPELVAGIGLFALGATALGLILTPLGTIITVVGTGLGIIGGGLGIITTVSTGVITALGGILAAALPIAGPFLAAAAAVTGLVLALQELHAGKHRGNLGGYNTIEERNAAAINLGEQLVPLQVGSQTPFSPVLNEGITNTSNNPLLNSNPFTNITPQLPGETSMGGGRAEGGWMMGGVAYEVGERGKETIVSPETAYVLNNRQTRGLGGGVTITNLNLYGVNDPQKLFDEIQKVARQRSM